MTLSAPPRRPVLRGATPSPHAAVRSALALLDGDGAGLRAVAADLAAGLSGGADDFRVERPDRLLYATDASIYEMEPVAVVFPRTADDVQHVLRVAGRRGVAVLPRGGGTSLAGQGVNHAIVLDFTPHMSRVLSIDAEARTARVQPGVVLTQLSAAAREHGLQFPVDPSTANRATIAGCRGAGCFLTRRRGRVGAGRSRRGGHGSRRPAARTPPDDQDPQRGLAGGTAHRRGSGRLCVGDVWPDSLALRPPKQSDVGGQTPCVAQHGAGDGARRSNRRR